MGFAFASFRLILISLILVPVIYVEGTDDQLQVKVLRRQVDQKCLEYSSFAFENVTGSTSTSGTDNSCPFDGTKIVTESKSVSAKEFPHLVRLGHGTIEDIKWGCVGSIISKRFVLTSSHCITRRNGPPTYVKLNFDPESQPQIIRVALVILHPDYKYLEVYNDIALLELSEDILFKRFARPACLNADVNLPDSTSGVIEARWKSTGNDVLKVPLELVKFIDCQRQYQPNQQKMNQGLIENQQLCAGMDDQESCRGVWGGPLHTYHGEFSCMYTIVAVDSFGMGCRGGPDVFTKVSNYIDWIEENAFKHG